MRIILIRAVNSLAWAKQHDQWVSNMQSLLSTKHHVCTRLGGALLSRAGKHVTAAMSSAAALTFDKHGEPAAVMQLSEVQLPNLGDTDVHLQML